MNYFKRKKVFFFNSKLQSLVFTTMLVVYFKQLIHDHLFYTDYVNNTNRARGSCNGPNPVTAARPVSSTHLRTSGGIWGPVWPVPAVKPRVYNNIKQMFEFEQYLRRLG